MKKILIVDDEPDILEFLKYNLNKEGFETYTATNGLEAIKTAKINIPDLIILDVMMPEMDGIETCRQLRTMSTFNNTVIIFLSARYEDYTQIMGLDVGADDYIVKPVKLRVLISKINAFFRRSEKSQDVKNIIDLGELIIDRNKYIVSYKGEDFSFPRKEFELLYLLASIPNKVFNREEIYGKLWGDDVIVGDRTIDVYIKKIRNKLGDDIIKTIKGVGYKFEMI